VLNEQSIETELVSQIILLSNTPVAYGQHVLLCVNLISENTEQLIHRFLKKFGKMMSETSIHTNSV